MSKYPNLEAERVRKGLSRRDLSGMIDINENTYATWQSGKHSIPLTKAFKLSEIFDRPIEYLFEEAK